MRIHQITHLFYPDQLAGAALYTDLAKFLRERGHDVRVTATFSYYPALHYSAEDAGITLREEEFAGIPLRRVGMYLPSKHRGARRLLPEISYAWRLVRHAQFGDWTPDVVLTACPMLAQCISQRFLYRGLRVPRLIVVQDLMVDAALELGIVKAPGLGLVLRFLENWALRSATTLATISPMMEKKLLPLGPRTVVIKNWIHESLAQSIATTPVPTRQKKALFYSGNLGIKQGLPAFLKTFSDLRDDWRLDIHGGGAEAARVREMASTIPAVKVNKLQPEQDYLTSLMAATACLITQMPGVGANFLPSKLLPALATGTPVLAICEPDSPLGTEVTAGAFGEVIRPGDAEHLRSVLSRWAAEPERLVQLGRAAKIHAANFSRETILPRYEEELTRLATGGTAGRTQ